VTLDPKVLARARALKAHAELNDNPHEAELASMRLAQYLDKHRLDIADLADGTAPFGRVTYALVGNRYLRASLALLVKVAKHYGVLVLVASTGNSKAPRLVGTETDIEMTVLMFESLVVQRDRACLASEVPYGVATATHRNSFCYGYAIRIGARLEELRERQRVAALAESDRKALAVYDRVDAVKKWLEEELGRDLGSANRNGPNLHAAAVRAGDQAARNADLGQTRVDDTRGPAAIGGGDHG
jgi:hypothetical protein